MIKLKISRTITLALVLATLLGNTAVAVKAESQKISVNQIPRVNFYNKVFSTPYAFTEMNVNWGLGRYQTEYVSNNRSYSWYID